MQKEKDDSLTESKITNDCSDTNVFDSINKWEFFLFYYSKNQSRLSFENDVEEKLQIIMKKIEIVNIAQSNLIGYIENLEYTRNLYESKKNGILKK